MIAKVLLLALLAVATSATPTAKNAGMVNFGQAINMYFQAWKHMLPCGYAPYNLPAMDPYNLEFFPFEYDNGDTNIKGNLSNIMVTGLSNFKVISGTYNTTTQHTAFDIIYPEIQVLGSYAIEGTVTVAGFPIPVRQSVLINKKVLDWRFVGDYTFAPSLTNPNGLRMSEINMNYYLGDVKVDMWDKFMDIAGNNFSNEFVRSLTLLVSEEVQPYVSDLYAKYALPMINSQLTNLNMGQLTEFLLEVAALWNNVPCTPAA